METLKLVGIGHKVLLVKDDVVKFVDLGGLFSSAKKEFLFSVCDISNVEIKKPESFSAGNIQIQGNRIAPSLQNTIFVTFKGLENYKIAVAMQEHIKTFSTETTQKSCSIRDSEIGEEQAQIRIPEELEGKRLTYRCPCVPVADPDFEVCLESVNRQEWAVDAKEVDGRCVLYSRGLKIGEIDNTDVSSMVLDWIHRGEPYRIYLFEVYTEDRAANISIAFYIDRRESLTKWDCDIIKLSACLSTEKQEWIPHISEGEELGVHEEYDIDSGKSYIGVFWDGIEIGHLPPKHSSRFLEQGIHGCFFEKSETDDKLRNIPYIKVYW